MEDKIVRDRCSAVVQQIVFGCKDKQLKQKEQQHAQRSRLLARVAEALKQKAIVTYRLCRAKGEKLSDDQTEDAAYCALAAVAWLQPALWATLVEWSRLLFPRTPVLRFLSPVAMVVRMKGVQHFIARSSWLQTDTPALMSVRPMPAASSSCGAKATDNPETEEPYGELRGQSRGKRPRDVKYNPQGAILEEEFVFQVALAYFRLTVPDVRKLHVIVASCQGAGKGTNWIADVDPQLLTPCQPFTSNRSTTRNSGANLCSNSNIRKEDADDEEEFGDTSLALLGVYVPMLDDATCQGAAAAGKEGSSLLTSSINLDTLANDVDSVRSVIYYTSLQRCLRNPLLFSSLGCITEGKNVEQANDNNVGSIQHSRASINMVNTATVTSPHSPAHFLHPSRVRLHSISPLPPQMVTANYLWRRLLVAALWLQVVGSHRPAGDDDDRVRRYCVMVVRAATEMDMTCLVCGGLLLEKPKLYLSALTRSAEGALEEGVEGFCKPWSDMGGPTPSADSWKEPTRDWDVLSRDILRGLAGRLHRKAVELAARNTADPGDVVGVAAPPSAVQENEGISVNCGVATSTSLSSTLREIIAEVCGTYPINACRAALIGSADSSAELQSAPHPQDSDEPSIAVPLRQSPGCSGHSGVPSNESLDMCGLLDVAPVVPRLRETDAVLECSGCFQLFHQICLCPAQRDIAGGCFLCHNCRLRYVSRLRLTQEPA